MSEMTLYRGNRNYSSWSMRAWLALKQAGAPFHEVAFDLGSPAAREELRRHSPSGKVPALRDGDTVVWDSLAICEYLAERFPGAGLWPADPATRAVARSVAAEMHSGFEALRREMPLNVRRSSPGAGHTEAALADVRRIRSIWAACRAAHGPGGRYLFGAWSLADVMFAPVVSRFRTYAVDVDSVDRDYMDAVWSRPDVAEWCAAAAAEPMTIPGFDR